MYRSRESNAWRDGMASPMVIWKWRQRKKVNIHILMMHFADLEFGIVTHNISQIIPLIIFLCSYFSVFFSKFHFCWKSTLLQNFTYLHNNVHPRWQKRQYHLYCETLYQPASWNYYWNQDHLSEFQIGITRQLSC